MTEFLSSTETFSNRIAVVSRIATDCDESLHFHLLRIDCQLRGHFVVLDNSTLRKQSTVYFGREVILLFLAFSGGSGIPV